MRKIKVIVFITSIIISSYVSAAQQDSIIDTRDLKILAEKKQIVNSYDFSHLNVVFPAREIKRWEHSSSLDSPLKVHLKEEEEKEYWYMPLGSEKVTSNKHPIYKDSNNNFKLIRSGTSDDKWSGFEYEDWYNVFVSFNPTNDPVKDTIIADGSQFYYIRGKAELIMTHENENNAFPDYKSNLMEDLKRKLRVLASSGFKEIYKNPFIEMAQQ